MIGIYKITNKINGKSYIGQSVNIQKRFNAHKSTAFNPNSKIYDSPLYKAIRKYGIENFEFKILEECDETELDDKEIFYISKYQTNSKMGYNQDSGGNQVSHYNKLSDDLVSKIIERLKNSLDNSDKIGEDFGVTGRVIRCINSGEYSHRNSEKYPIRPPLFKMATNNAHSCCEICNKEISNYSKYCVECSHLIQRHVDNRPSPLELAKMVKENGFSYTGRLFGVSDNTIKKWCRSYKIPHLRNELASWYDNQIKTI